MHSNFTPAERHRNQYADVTLDLPASAELDKNNPGRPLWVRNQRNSFHGIEFPYHDPGTDLLAIQRNYHRTMSAVDDSVGRILDWLDGNGEADNTVVIYTSDNGFLFRRTRAHRQTQRVRGIDPGADDRQRAGAVSPRHDGIGAGSESRYRTDDPGPGRAQAFRSQFEGRSFRGLAEGSTDPADWREDRAVRVFLGVQFPAYAHHLRRQDQRLQADSIPRHLGYGRALRLAGGIRGK